VVPVLARARLGGLAACCSAHPAHRAESGRAKSGQKGALVGSRAPSPRPASCLHRAGVHMNGYVTLPDGGKELWVARRSRAKPTWPGKLDHIVAGGQVGGGCVRPSAF
jgi:hypothetical protein